MCSHAKKIAQKAWKLAQACLHRQRVEQMQERDLVWLLVLKKETKIRKIKKLNEKKSNKKCRKEPWSGC